MPPHTHAAKLVCDDANGAFDEDERHHSRFVHKLRLRRVQRIFDGNVRKLLCKTALETKIHSDILCAWEESKRKNEEKKTTNL